MKIRTTMRRGQTAIEFIVLFGFMLFVFTAFFYVMQERSAIAKEQSNQAELRGVGEIIVQEVSTANRVKDGYARTFELPASLATGAYTVTLSGNSEVVIRTADDEYLVFLPTDINSTGITPGKNVITKADGRINITASGALPVTQSVLCSFENAVVKTTCRAGGSRSCTVTPPTTSCEVIVIGLPGEVLTWESTPYCGTFTLTISENSDAVLPFNCGEIIVPPPPGGGDDEIPIDNPPPQPPGETI